MPIKQPKLKVFIGGDSKGAKKAFEQTMSIAKTSMAAVGVAVAGATAAVALMVSKQLEVIDLQAKTADKLGLTTEALAGLRHAAELSGVGAAGMDIAMQRMVRRLADAKKGAGPAAKAIKQLGLDAAELSNKSPDAAFRDIADAMQLIPAHGDKVRLTFALFDSGGVGLVNTMAAGSEGLRKAAQEADTFGLSISRIDAAKIETANDSITRATSVITGMEKQMTVALAPAIDTVFTQFVMATTDSEKGVNLLAESVVGVLVESLKIGTTGVAVMAKGFAVMQTPVDAARIMIDGVALSTVQAFDVMVAGLDVFYGALAKIPGKNGEIYAQAQKDVQGFRGEIAKIEEGIKATGNASINKFLDGTVQAEKSWTKIDKKIQSVFNALEKSKTKSASTPTSKKPTSLFAIDSEGNGGDVKAIKNSRSTAQKIIDITSQKFARMQIIGAAAFGDEKARLQATLDAALSVIDVEEKRTLEAAAKQGVGKQELDNLESFYAQKSIDLAQKTADKIVAIDAANDPSIKALADAKKVIDIHSAKFARIEALGTAAFGTEQDKLQAGLEAKVVALDIESANVIAAAQLQGADTVSIQAYYDEQKINAYQSVADRVAEIDDVEHAKAMERMTAQQQTALDLKQQFSEIANGNQQINLSNMTDNLIAFAKTSIDLDKFTADQKLQFASGIFGSMSSLMQSHNRKAFEVGKAAAQGENAIQTYLGATKAYTSLAGISIVGPFLGAAAAAAVIASGVANAQRIASSKMGGNTSGASVPSPSSSGGSFGGGASYGAGNPAPVPQAQQKPQQAINVYINGVTSQDQLVNEIIPLALQHQVNNNDLILINQNSAQAQTLTA